MNMITLCAITADAFTGLQRQAAQDGMVIVGTQGELQSHGCTIGYNYSRASQVLVLTVIDKPWIYPMGTVIEQLKAVVTQALTRAGATWQE